MLAGNSFDHSGSHHAFGHDQSVSHQFDQVFGTSHYVGGKLYGATKMTADGGKELIVDGRTVASTKPTFFHDGGHDTYESGKQVASTKPNVQGGDDIYRHGKQIGSLDTNVTGEGELYVGGEKVAHTYHGSTGVQVIMDSPDPLSQAHRLALNELILGD